MPIANKAENLWEVLTCKVTWPHIGNHLKKWLLCVNLWCRVKIVVAPKLDPWGTPCFIKSSSESVQLTDILLFHKHHNIPDLRLISYDVLYQKLCEGL